MGYKIPIKIPKQFTVPDMEFAIQENEVFKYDLDMDRLFVYLPLDTPETSILNTYNLIQQYSADKIIGKINEFVYTPAEISIDFELFERTLYGPMIKYLLNDIVKSNPHIVPSIIYDSQTNKIKNILGFTLYMNQFVYPEP